MSLSAVPLALGACLFTWLESMAELWEITLSFYTLLLLSLSLSLSLCVCVLLRSIKGDLSHLL